MKNSAFENFSEKALEALDFARCQRPNGTFYGTAGICKSGASVGAKEKEAPKGRAKAAPKAAAPKSSGAPSAKEVKALDRTAKAADKKADAADKKFQKSKSPADRKEARRLDKEAKAANKAADKADKAFQKSSKAKLSPTAEAKASKDPEVQKRVLQTELKKVSARYEKLRGKPEASAERKKLMDRAGEITKAQQAIQKRIDAKSATPKKPDTSLPAQQRRSAAAARARD